MSNGSGVPHRCAVTPPSGGVHSGAWSYEDVGFGREERALFTRQPQLQESAAAARLTEESYDLGKARGAVDLVTDRWRPLGTERPAGPRRRVYSQLRPVRALSFPAEPGNLTAHSVGAGHRPCNGR